MVFDKEKNKNTDYLPPTPTPSCNLTLKRAVVCMQKSMSTYVADCYDGIAVFLCIHIILRFRAIAAKRNIPALDK